MKKVLIFSTAYFPFVGGAEVAVKEITDRMDEISARGGSISDWKFDMITTRMNRRVTAFEKIGNVNVHRIGIGWPLFDKYFLAFFGHFYAIELHRKNKYDLIWSIMASYAGFAAMFFKKKSKIPFLLTLQEGDSLEYINKRTRLLKQSFRQIFIRADYIQCISNFLADWARKMGANCSIKVVPNAVDIDNFNQHIIVGELNKLKTDLGKKENDIFLIHDGRLVLKNALDDIIKALSYLPDNVKFLSVGSGSDLNKLKKIAKDLKVEKRVIFINYVNHKELPKYLRISDIFVRPSLSEGLGNSFLEAMAAEIPVIATPVGGIPDFLKDGETGLFCEVRNPKSIAKKIKLILSDKELSHRLIVNAKKMVLTKYDWNIISCDMNKIFCNLIK